MFIYYVVAKNGKLWNPENAMFLVALADSGELGSGRNG